MNLEQFKSYAQDYNAIPVYRRLMADTLTPVSLFLKLKEEGGYHFLLESVEGGEQLARYSFLGRNPYQLLRYEEQEVTVTKKGNIQEASGDYFSVLEQLTTAYREPDIPEMPHFTGGAVGFSGYDTVRDIEHLPNQPDDDLKLPDAVWAFYDAIYVFDHVKQQIILIKTVFTDENSDTADRQFDEVQHQLDQMEALLFDQPIKQQEVSIQTDAMKSNTPKEKFIETVNKIKHYITEGDIFQTVPSQRFEVPFEGDRFMLYRALRMVNPSPYLFYLNFDGLTLAGSSPEVLSRLREEEATVLPIAGTRHRGDTEQEDQALARKLKADPKENAEHVMLVDLGRNDLSRVCKPNTVHPVKDRVVMRYSHVMHLVSEVQGKIREDESAVSLLAKTFPAGTVSGAPKVRAMEIIDEMEPTKRGPYAGAVGYFDFSGNMDTCIAIRTMVITNGSIYIQTGAGIVADSDPEKEYIETNNKAAALIEALDVAANI